MSILDDSAARGGSLIDPIAAKIKNPFQKKVSRQGERPIDFPAGFVITEFVGGMRIANTEIRLLGNLMPMQPFEWETEQRLVTNWYPGNPEPAVHVLGFKRGPVTIKGRFKDKRYKDPSYYGVAYQYARACEEMQKRGNILRFGMHGPAGDWIRYGYIEKTSFKMDIQARIEYEITFLLVSTTMPRNNYFVSRDQTSPDGVNQTLINSAATFQSTYSAVPESMPQSISGFLNDIISGVAKNVNLVTGFVDTLISTAADIKASANRAIGLIKNARTQLAIYRRQIGQLTGNFQNLSSQGNNVGKVRDTYNNLAFLTNMRAQMNTVSSDMARMQARFLAISVTIPLARYKVVDGDTLQRISVRYYQAPDNWKDIYDHNKLQSTILVGGQVLEIPKL